MAHWSIDCTPWWQLRTTNGCNRRIETCISCGDCVVGKWSMNLDKLLRWFDFYYVCLRHINDAVRYANNGCNELQEGVWTVCAHFAFCISPSIEWKRNQSNHMPVELDAVRFRWMGAWMGLHAKCRTVDGECNRMKCVQIMNALSISNASDDIDWPIPYSISNISHLHIPESSIRWSTIVVTL